MSLTLDFKPGSSDLTQERSQRLHLKDGAAAQNTVVSLEISARINKAPNQQSYGMQHSQENPMSETAKSTIDQAEVDRFSAMAAEWWDPTGKFKPLHKINPVRLAYIRDKACENYQRDPRSNQPLSGLRVLDIGCGGGLLSEPIARMGANVLGADASAKNIGIAQTHAAQTGVSVDYRAVTAEALAAAGESFDIVLNMEVVEHVADVEYFISTCASMVRPGGIMLISTINRTLKAAALAIGACEYVLRWLPRGTHQYEKLVRPEELEKPILGAGMDVTETVGVFFNPFQNQWNLSTDTDVNYMMLTRRPTSTPE